MYNCVVINYNNLDILSESIPLLLADGLRVVVVDNGSDDGSREYLASCQGILAILNDQNRGSSTARNQGLDHCHGDVLLLDSDILYIPGSYAYLAELSRSAGVACAGFHHYTYTRVKEDAWPDLVTKKPKVVRGTFAYTHYAFFQAEVFRKCRFDENFGIGWGFEDNDLTFQMNALGMKSICARATYFHRKKSSVEHLKSRGQSSRFGARLKYFRTKWGIARIHPQRVRRRSSTPAQGA
ncbi:MAG TPA: glycosyltransferase [Verrucomicrobiae bacterium]|nr:glycosyltransferase [Verrucomicrobiae bacterium]